MNDADREWTDYEKHFLALGWCPGPKPIHSVVGFGAVQFYLERFFR